MRLWKLEVYYNFFPVVISYPTKNRGSGSENVASLCHQENPNAEKKIYSIFRKSS